jgi:hypothetical protein
MRPSDGDDGDMLHLTIFNDNQVSRPCADVYNSGTSFLLLSC